MRARVEATLQCDHDLLSGGEVCVERVPGNLVICIGTVREATMVGLIPPQTAVLQPVQVSVRNPAWAVIAYGPTTYVLCPKHASAGREALAKKRAPR